MKNNLHLKNLKNWIPFFPLLLILLSITFLLSENVLQGDEGRYLKFSENLLNGYYANPELDQGFLWNGPGYPIILVPFKFFNFPFILIKVLNSIFLFFGVIFLYKSLRFNLNHKISLFFSYVGGITHPFFFKSITLILTESLCFFLISISLYYFLKYMNTRNKKYIYIFGISSGFLILTKVFFSYVFLVLGVLSVLLFLFYDKKEKFLLKLSFYPFIICIPYLIYTYSLTGKIFYWSDAGGNTLYCMSTPFEGEYGDWFPITVDESSFIENLSKKSFHSFKPNTLKKNHLTFFKSIDSLNGINKDVILKNQALDNIFENKIKFLKNIVYNFGRVSIGYPLTSTYKNPLITISYVFHFSLLLTPLLISIFLIVYKNNLDFKIILSFFSIFLILTLLLPAGPRFIFPIYPIIIFIVSTLLINQSKIIPVDNEI